MNQDTYQTLGTLQKKRLIKFKPDTSQQILSHLRKIEILKYSLQKLNLKLKKNQINKNQVAQNEKITNIFQYIERVDLQQLKIFKQSFDGPLFLTLSYVKFEILQQLYLSDCNVFSVQFLTFFDVPRLKKLNLYGNHLVHLNAISKVKLPKLFWLQLGGNHFKDARGLQRTDIAKRMALIEVSEKNQEQNQSVFTFFSEWLFKLPFDHINYVRKRQKYLHLNKKHLRKSKQKYPFLDFR